MGESLEYDDGSMYLDPPDGDRFREMERQIAGAVHERDVALAQLAAVTAYRNAIDNAMAIRALGVALGDPEGELNTIIGWEIELSHDPRVSKRAKDKEDQLAAVTQQRDELVEAVGKFGEAEEADVFLDIVGDSDGHVENAAELNAAALRRGDALKAMRKLAARIQSTQPQGIPAYQPGEGGGDDCHDTDC